MVLKQGKFEKYERPQPVSMYTFAEKAVSAICYVPAMVGFLVGIVYILAKGPGCDRPFFRFHFYQSIFLSVLMYIIQAGASGSSDLIIGVLRLFEGLIGSSTVLFLSSNLQYVSWALYTPFVLLLPYGAIMALLGKFSNIPWVSNVIRSNMAGR